MEGSSSNSSSSIFGMESTDRLSTGAIQLINDMSKCNEPARPLQLLEACRHVLRQLSVSTARANAVMIAAARSKLVESNNTPLLIDELLPPIGPGVIVHLIITKNSLSD